MNNKKIIKILTACLVLCIILGFIYYRESQPHNLEVYFLDIGQGDAILIRTPDNQDILIDGGPDNKILLELGEVLPFWDRDIELMILTHPHEDHVTGLVHVLERYEVKQVLFNDVDYDSENFDMFKQMIHDKNILANNSYYGDKINLAPDLYLETIFPFRNIDLNEIENINNVSIVNRLVYKDNKLLFTGDAEAEVEEMILYNKIKVESDVLKVGHHGSKTSSSQEFLDAVNPQQAIIQCGQGNKFKHPHFITLYKLKHMGIPVFRNDIDGRIKCDADGFEIKCDKVL